MHTRCHDTWFTRSVRCVHDCRCTLVMRGCSLERFARGRCGISKCGSLLDVCGTPMARLTRVRRGILWTSSLCSCAVSCSSRLTHIVRGFRSIGSLGLCAVVPAFGALSSCAVLPGTVRSVHTLYSLHAVSLPYNAVTYLTARSTVPWCLWITTGSTLGSLFSGLPFDPAHSIHARYPARSGSLGFGVVIWSTGSLECVAVASEAVHSVQSRSYGPGVHSFSARCSARNGSLNSCAVSCSFRFTQDRRGFVPIRCTPSMRGCLKRRFARLTRGVLGFGTRSPVPWCST